MPVTNALEFWIHSAGARALGWTLAHFAWEGAAIAAILALLLAVFRGASARLRYGLACAALLAMPIAFGVTLAVSLPHSPAPVITRVPLPQPASVPFTVESPAPPASWSFTNLMPWAAPLWLAGVAGLLLYRFASWIAAQRLRRRGTCAAPEEWSRRFNALVDRLGISQSVILLESCLAEVPMVIGYLRPVILVPIGMLAGWPLDQVEAILLHELAHIRRVDYLVNLLQTIVESLLFYHPAVWWVSGVVRAERENCCDDFVLARETDPRTYAAALLALEQRRCAVDRGVEPGVKHGPMALAANGGVLLKRVRRILEGRKPAARDSNLAIGPVALAILGAGIALAAWQPEVVKKSEIVRPETAQLDIVRHQSGQASTTPHLSANAQPGLRIQGTINHFPEPVRLQVIQELQPAIDRLKAVGDRNMLIAQAQQSQPVTDQQKKQQDERLQQALDGLQRLRQESETPYRKWLNEDVAYIITDAERKTFQALTTDNDREQFIDQFWKRRDPTPDTEKNEYREEHYRRIAYANEHLAPTGGIPGWKTDRGRIYISYGPADEIESHPSGGSYQRPPTQGGGTTTTYPFEQWRYRFIEGMGQNITLEFVDGERNGEYHLTMDPSLKEQTNPSLATPEQGGRGRGARGAPPAGARQFDRPRDSMPSMAPAGQPMEVVAGVPYKQSDVIRQQLATLRTKYTDEHPDVQATQARLDQALRDEAANPSGGFHGKHAGVLIYPEGKVTFVIPLDGTGPFHVYGRVVTPDGKPIAFFEDNANTGQLNYVGTFTLKPGSYIFSAARKVGTETEGATETVTFEVK